jgi:hypothetical protein
MYVGDQYAERTFYELFGFQRVYEGWEFPVLLAIGHGEASIGLQRASPGQPAYLQGLAGSSSSAALTRSTRSSRPATPTAWSTRLSSSEVATGFSAAWSPSSPCAG